MEVVNEAFCSFIESRAKFVSEPEKILMESKVDRPKEHKHMFEVLDLTQKKLKKSKWQKRYECFPYKGGFAFAILIIMLIVSWIAQFKKLWWLGLFGLVITVYISIMYVISNRRSWKNQNWVYKIALNLRLLLWKIPPIDNDMKNPRCVFVYFNENDDYEDWITSHVLPKLQHDLKIKMSDEFAHSLQNDDSSSREFQEYSYWRDAVIGPLGNVPKWCFCIIILVGISGIIAGAIHNCVTNELVLSWVACISSAVAFCGFIYKIATYIPTGPDIGANKLFDVICRLHRVMRNETIFFTLVNFNGTIPHKWSQYFKFVIDFRDKERSDPEYHHCFYWNYDKPLSELYRVKSPAYIKLDKFLKVVLQRFRVGISRSTPGYPFSSVLKKNAMEFLSHLVKTNDPHNISSGIDILRTVCRSVSIDSTYPDRCGLFFGNRCNILEVDVESKKEIQLSLSDLKTLGVNLESISLKKYSKNMDRRFYIELDTIR